MGNADQPVATDEIEPPYRVESTESQFRVVDESGRTVLSTGNRENAEQYAAMLNQAFQRGFKSGYRAAKRGLDSSRRKT
jgi:hypothetical protein